MTKRNLLIAVGTAALGISLAALPGVSKQPQAQLPQDDSVAALNRQIAEFKAKLAPTQPVEELQAPEIGAQIEEGPEIFVDREIFNIEEPQAPEPPSAHTMVMTLDSEGGSWLGVETQEVSSEKAKELK